MSLEHHDLFVWATQPRVNTSCLEMTLVFISAFAENCVSFWAERWEISAGDITQPASSVRHFPLRGTQPVPRPRSIASSSRA